MASHAEIYVCDLCGNVIEVLEAAGGVLVCCGQDMTLRKENTTDVAKEKHVPVATVNGTIATIQVGSVAHPMESQHYIVWIELQQKNKVQRIYLKSGEAPQAVFVVEPDAPVTVRAYCNLHGLWNA